MSEQTSNPTSGQNVPKSKFRRKSQQEQTAASKLRMEKRGEKLDAAREKLAKQKPPKKPGAVKRLTHAAGHGVHGFVHGKLYEVEHENVGTEGAHRSELVAESVYRFGRRKLRKAIRGHPAKAVERAESKHIKATADYYYRKTVEEHPEMQEGGAVSRYLQKQKIKRQYAKQAREAARQTGKAAEGTASVTGKLTEKVSAYIKEHPGGVLLLLAAFLLLVVLQSCMSSLVTVGNGVAGAIGASTYAAEDTDLLGAEAAYCALEDELQRYLDTYTRTHDYDEYHFDLDTIEHDPYVLLSIVCALHEGEWTLDEVRGTLQMLFDRQYILTEDVVVERRYYLETDTWTDEDGNTHSDTYRVYYDYYICTVTLENSNGAQSENVPRTAVGLKEDGTLVVFAVESLRYGNSHVIGDIKEDDSYGLNLPQLADFMIYYGIETGANFDGGGSTQLIARQGADADPKVIIRSSDTGSYTLAASRKVMNTLMVTTK